jgi:hypothetical protein
MRFLTTGVKLEIKDMAREAILHEATCSGHLDSEGARFLVKAGAEGKLDGESMKGEIELHDAACGRHLEGYGIFD